MGITGSRGKKVAPEGLPSAQAITCQNSSVGISRKSTQQDRLSNKQVVPFSVHERNLAEEVDRILEACENTEHRKKSFLKSPLHMHSVTTNYAFSYNQREQHDIGTESTHADLLKPGGLEDNKDICTSNILNRTQKQTAVTETLRADPECTNTTHVPGICDDILLALPVSYDASEEDLMSAIEREFG